MRVECSGGGRGSDTVCVTEVGLGEGWVTGRV